MVKQVKSQVDHRICWRSLKARVPVHQSRQCSIHGEARCVRRSWEGPSNDYDLQFRDVWLVWVCSLHVYIPSTLPKGSIRCFNGWLNFQTSRDDSVEFWDVKTRCSRSPPPKSKELTLFATIAQVLVEWSMSNFLYIACNKGTAYLYIQNHHSTVWAYMVGVTF